MGEQAVCQDDGTYTIETVKTCQELYNLVGVKGVDDLNEWLQKCFNAPGRKFNNITCDDSSGHPQVNI